MPEPMSCSTPSKPRNNDKVSRERAARKSFHTWQDAARTYGLGAPSASWPYHDASGAVVGVICRWQGPGGKEIRPVTLMDGFWSPCAMQPPRPLYGLPAVLRADMKTPIVVVEGEKTADAARRCGLTAVTSAGGAKAAAKSDWTPLRGRQVIILPDHDDAGASYAQDVARLAVAAGAKGVRILRLADYATELPKGGDLADVLESSTWCGLPLAAGAGPEDVGRWMIATAESLEPWEPEPAERIKPLEWQPYPVDALPEPIRTFVTTTARGFGCDESYIALPLIVAMAAAIGTTRRLEPKPRWLVPPILWAAIVGESGTLKTPALRAALCWTQKRQDALFNDYDASRQQFDIERLAYEKALAEWKRSKADALPPERPEPPTAGRVLVADTTVEGLAPILQANPRGVLLGRDELAGWVGNFDRYASTPGGDAPFWLSAYNAVPCVIDRKTTGTLRVPTTAVSIVGGIQPRILARALGPVNRENGLLARLLVTMPPRQPKRWTEAGVERAAADSVGKVFDRLFSLEHDIDDDGTPTPRTMRLSARAKQRYVEFYNEHAEDLADATGDWAAALAKLEELPLRFGLVLHLVRWAAGENVNPDIVDGDSMARAIELTAWHKHETLRVYEALDDTEEESERRKLVEWIARRGGSVTARDLYCGGPRRFRGESGEAEAALQTLAKDGYGVWEDVPANNRGGRPTRVFRLRNQWQRNQNLAKHGENMGFDSDSSDATDETAPNEPETVNPTTPDGGSVDPSQPNDLESSIMWFEL
ncbi:YfjI family protein [Thermopirellula anaerolimosa]